MPISDYVTIAPSGGSIKRSQNPDGGVYRCKDASITFGDNFVREVIKANAFEYCTIVEKEGAMFLAFSKEAGIASMRISVSSSSDSHWITNGKLRHIIAPKNDKYVMLPLEEHDSEYAVYQLLIVR